MTIQLALFICSACLNAISMCLLLAYGRRSKQPSKPVDELINYAKQQSETITKAVELQNAYTNALFYITSRTGITEEEKEVMDEVQMKQRNFLYHLRKLNPNYSIIKDEI